MYDKKVDKSMLNEEEKALVEVGKKRGRPEGKNYKFFKGIKLNQKQVDNWDSNKIKAFLDGSLKPKEINNSEVIQKFKRLYDIMNAWMLGKMNNAQIENIPEDVLEEIEEIEEILNV